MLADPFLAFVCRVLWSNKMPTADDGKFGVYRVLDHTIKHAPGHVGYPICLATLTKNKDGKWIAKEEDTGSLPRVIVFEDTSGYCRFDMMVEPLCVSDWACCGDNNRVSKDSDFRIGWEVD
jgi:hypothetical protein